MGTGYSAYLLPDRVSWIGDISVVKFKSEIFCLHLLSSLVSKVVKPILQLQSLNLISNSISWIHVDNIWVRDNSVFYILCRRKENNNRSQNVSEKMSINTI